MTLQLNRELFIQTNANAASMVLWGGNNLKECARSFSCIEVPLEPAAPEVKPLGVDLVIFAECGCVEAAFGLLLDKLLPITGTVFFGYGTPSQSLCIVRE